MQAEDRQLAEAYGRVYSGLGELREVFHRSGRLDDSNAKLDEIAKMFATYVAEKAGNPIEFPDAEDADLLERLGVAFRKTAELPEYRDREGRSIFGPSPSLVLRAGDEQLARQLVAVVRQAVDDAFAVRQAGHPFDLLNEAFGHFVRDNFRGNIEDAQYLTPPEVTQFMVRLVLEDLGRTDELTQVADRDWVFMDPTCGVGSFLTTVYDLAPQVGWLAREQVQLVAQDKVDRMVRLCTINMQMFEAGGHQVSQGDSALEGTPLDDWIGKVDVILTNPPFGARIMAEEVRQGRNTAPFLSSTVDRGVIDSELLFLERNLEFLREGGRMLIVLPDGVVSARGMAAKLRRHLQDEVRLRALVELPATTFAQAGTRTKTVVLYLQKGKARGDEPAVMGVVEELGFDVSSRKGVLVKKPVGVNELPALLDAIEAQDMEAGVRAATVLLERPSAVVVPNREIWRGAWTPRHFSAERVAIIGSQGADASVDMTKLDLLVDFVGSRPSKHSASEVEPACISVKHVLGEGFLDVHAALAYRPKTPGPRVTAGDLLLSKINPRIPRICVVPDLGRPMTCSSEFEIMRMKAGSPLTLYSLAFLLQSEVVQRQIGSLTSGTSSSHNRIRTTELAEVLIPVPVKGTDHAKALAEIGEQYRSAVDAMNHAALSIARLSEERRSLLQP
ncbi:MAG: N-6 DNA methylase [Actinomycetota bacterium]|nr:N-6 DNA methylase [Actinomycetota bacterium]